MLWSRLFPVFALFFVVANTAKSQAIRDFDYLGDAYANRELYIGLAASKTYLSNTEMPNPSAHAQTGFTADINMRKVNFEAFEFRWSWQNKLLGDMINLSRQVFNSPNKIYRSEGTGFSTGLIGWYDAWLNMNDPSGRVSWGVGLSLNDYFYTTTIVHDTIQSQGNRGTYQPEGYYFAAGPTAIIDFQINRWFVLEADASYCWSYWKPISLSYAVQDPSYKMPGWGQVNLELITRIGFHLSMNYNWIHNRGTLPSNGKRFDMLLGFRFMV